ncbi:Hypothetical predicted protein [Octopus vulgaris]|uniref:Uncharacterized protein n=1 Tax=Octopus vulgaris TaxID=6645 RepID=A0AA36BCN7_OCTVU|nr:Hypothetical predicted protein [Octopus vulgaris]
MKVFYVSEGLIPSPGLLPQDQQLPLKDRRQCLDAAAESGHRAESDSVQTSRYRCDIYWSLCASSFGLRSKAPRR